MLQVKILQKMDEKIDTLHDNIRTNISISRYLETLVQQHGHYIFSDDQREKITKSIHSLDNSLEEIMFDLCDITNLIEDALVTYENVSSELGEALKKYEIEDSDTCSLLEKPSKKKKTKSFLTRFCLKLFNPFTP